MEAGIASSQPLHQLIEKLVGERAPLGSVLPDTSIRLLSPGESGLGYSQLNELLLLLGFDRVTHSFFQYLVDGTVEHAPVATLSSLTAFENGVNRFRKLALLLFGNVKHAFKTLSRDAELLAVEVSRLTTVPDDHFRDRHQPVRPINPIPGGHAYYLGYIVERELSERLKDAGDTLAVEEEKLRTAIVQQGKDNHEAYLASDHLDVYVATSMRERHEFAIVSRLTREIFAEETLSSLKLRWFDPTQAYCKDRIDKGLAEALMLRRAQCTIYLAQESDTLGKDSELASTLAQGKPVIAFVPQVDPGYASRLLADLRSAYPDESEQSLVLRQLRLFDPGSAWTDATIQRWVTAPMSMVVGIAMQRLQEKIAEHYNKRATTLAASHPLGIQVNLATGVANGVLVVRTVSDCAQLIRRIVTRTLEFDLVEAGDYLLLREKISGCVFRVATGDAMLTNAFWNFYLEPSE